MPGTAVARKIACRKRIMKKYSRAALRARKRAEASKRSAKK